MDTPTQTKNIIIYSTPTCHFCHLTKDFLSNHSIAFTDYNVAENVEKRNEMMQKTGQMGVPVILVSDILSDEDKQAGKTASEEVIIGFDEERFRTLLNITE